MPPLNIKLLSDIHLELMKGYLGMSHFIPPDQDVDIICLCGDIGDPSKPSFAQFLKDCTMRCNMHTFLIMGNHEAYGNTVEKAANNVAQICTNINEHNGTDIQKLVFLNNTSFDIPHHNLRVLGSTLWTEVDPQEAWDIQCFISDFRRIQQWGIGDNNEAFHTNIAWLRASLQQAREDEVKTIIMTHHVPLMNLGHPRHAASPLKSAFSSDLYNFIKANTDVISYWFYGHDHFSTKKIIDTTTIMSNQMGYEGEESMTHFNHDLVIEY